MTKGRIALAATAAAAMVVLGATGAARADQIRINEECTFSGAVDCELGCTDVRFAAMCDLDFEARCSGRCDFDASLDCRADCEAECVGRCDVSAPQIECVGYCEGECQASCDGYCAGSADRVRCMSECTGTCSASCQGYCDVDPGEVDCSGRCTAACRGSCQAEANLDCNVGCTADVRGECEAELRGDCTADCDTAGGVLICNGEVTTFGGYDDVIAYARSRGIRVDVDVDISGNFEARAICSVGSFAPSSAPAVAGLLLLALLGLVVTAARRRR